MKFANYYEARRWAKEAKKAIEANTHFYVGLKELHRFASRVMYYQREKGLTFSIEELELALLNLVRYPD
jgi:hypothetical protein